MVSINMSEQQETPTIFEMDDVASDMFCVISDDPQNESVINSIKIQQDLTQTISEERLENRNRITVDSTDFFEYPEYLDETEPQIPLQTAASLNFFETNADFTRSDMDPSESVISDASKLIIFKHYFTLLY